MTLPNGFDLATDAAFRLVAGFTEPPKAGRILSIEASGQYRIELDDADGGEVLAWGLNGFEYAAGDVIYVMFAANAPESGIIVGSLAPAPTLPGSVIEDHDDYALLPGRAGGQHLRGGTASGNNLTLESTGHATKGDVRIQPNGGNAGIGPASPATTLSVSGAGSNGIELAQDTGDSANSVRLFFHGALGTFAVLTRNNVLQFRSEAAVGSSTGTTRMVIKGDGDVGIGAASPQARLHVAFDAGGGQALESVSLTSTGTWVTVLSSGTVTGLLQLRAVIVPSSGAAGTVSATLTPGGGPSTIYSVGGNSVQAEVTAGGLFRVRRSAGSATFVVAVDVLWV